MKIQYLFRKPAYPVIAEFDSKVIAGLSESMLLKEMKKIGAFKKSSYEVIDSNGKVWIFDIHELTLYPFSFKNNRTKKDLINLVNSRTNKPENESPYSVKSISSKRYETVFNDLVKILKS